MNHSRLEPSESLVSGKMPLKNIGVKSGQKEKISNGLQQDGMKNTQQQSDAKIANSLKID